MTAPSRKAVPHQTLLRFGRYLKQHPSWGSLHIVLDDDNVENHHVEFCKKYAMENGDTEGAELAELLLGMSESQRLNLNRRINAAETTTTPS